MPARTKGIIEGLEEWPKHSSTIKVPASVNNTGESLKHLVYNSLKAIARKSKVLTALHSISHLRTVPYNVPFQVSNVYPFHSKTDLKLITIIINFKRENLMLEDNHYQHRELQMLKHTHKYYFLLLDSYLVKF